MQTTLFERQEVLEDLYKERASRYENLHIELSNLSSSDVAKWRVCNRYRADVEQIDRTIRNIEKALRGKTK